LGTYQVVVDPGGKRIGSSDLDGDYDLDIITTGISLTGPDKDDVIIIRNNGNGNFLTSERFPSGGGEDDIGSMALDDVDRDGYIDAGIILYGPSSGNENDKLTDNWALLRNDG